MLKKTDYSRSSMKGRKASGTSNGSSPFSESPSSPPVVYQTPSSVGARQKYQAPSPNKHLIAPGLVIEGEEADL